MSFETIINGVASLITIGGFFVALSRWLGSRRQPTYQPPNPASGNDAGAPYSSGTPYSSPPAKYRPVPQPSTPTNTAPPATASSDPFFVVTLPPIWPGWIAMLFAGGLAGTILFGVPGLFVSRWPDPLRVVAVLSMALTLFSLPINVLVDTAQLARARKIVLTIVGIMCTIIAFLVAIVGVVFELAVLTVLNVDTFRTGFIGWLVIGFIDLVIAGWRVGLDSVLFDHARGA